ncbi:MAG: toll/interleukin-1 receptor domain-containing protein, partial [Lachnospiraceae bacterium]|nr:toll/interleukin-1 receptor domain-containing protein [Lachnospiraceae bacterium]
MEELISRSKKAYYELLRDGWIPGEDYVFISYSSRDWEKAYPCVLALRALGINVYIDIEFQENQSSSWLKNLQVRLFEEYGCMGIVSFLSIDYMRSYACLAEQLANRTARMHTLMGKPLPVFYVALDPDLSTLSGMHSCIYQNSVRRESMRHQVEMSPQEFLFLQESILDCNLERYRDEKSVQKLLNNIHNKHNVVTTMYELIFSDKKEMPNFLLYEGAESCAKLLRDNFVNDKNDSIQLRVLEDLQEETRRRLTEFLPEEEQGPVTGGKAEESGMTESLPGEKAEESGMTESVPGEKAEYSRMTESITGV